MLKHIPAVAAIHGQADHLPVGKIGRGLDKVNLVGNAGKQPVEYSLWQKRVGETSRTAASHRPGLSQNGFFIDEIG